MMTASSMFGHCLSVQPSASPHRQGRRNQKQNLNERRCMGLFTADLYRSFAIGFGIGTVGIIIAFATQMFSA
jgi:hypothetical protein